MATHLLLRLEGPLAAFGAPIIDNHGAIQDFPAPSMLTGLLGNALGYRREEAPCLQRLQDRLIYGVRLDRPPADRFTDFQTVALSRSDAGWTTRGQPEGREGGLGESDIHIRYREYDADVCALLALRLEPPEEAPDLHDLAAALAQPARPLFLGRKPCLPASPLLVGEIEAGNVLGALCAAEPLVPVRADRPAEVSAFWPPGEGRQEHMVEIAMTGRRDWRSGVHGGQMRLLRGSIPLTDSETGQ